MNPKFKLGDLVRKTKGSEWHGTVVGTYSTSLTPEGYAVESATERGSVQIYPAAALEALKAEIEALRAEREVIVAEAVKYADKSGRLEAKVDRAAVAELMEAATDAHDFAVNMARNNGEELDRRFYRLRAAILNMSS